MEIRGYVSLVRRWFWMILLFSLAAAGASYVIAKSLPPMYESSTILLVSQAHPLGSTSSSDISASQQLTKTYSELIHTRAVLKAAISDLKLPYTPEELSGMVKVAPVKDTLLLDLKVTSRSPEEAADIANAMAQAFVAQTSQAELGQAAHSREALQQQLRALEEEISTTSDNLVPRVVYSELLKMLKSDQTAHLADSIAYLSVSVVERAVTPIRPVGPGTALIVAIAALVGAVLAIGAALAIESFDDTVRSSERALTILGAPALGQVIRLKDREAQSLRTLTEPASFSPAVESYRVLSANLQYTMMDSPGKAIMISSAAPGEGKTLTAISLARALAQTGKRVILVDADLRKPTVHKCLHLSNERGLSTALMDLSSVDDGLGEDGPLKPTPFWNLAVMTSGPILPDPPQLLASPRMTELVRLLKQKADIVLFDTAPVLEVSDSVILAASVDAMLLVVDSSRTKASALARVREMLEYSVGPDRPIGVVLNKLKPTSDGYYYYHGYPKERVVDAGATGKPADRG